MLVLPGHGAYRVERRNVEQKVMEVTYGKHLGYTVMSLQEFADSERAKHEMAKGHERDAKARGLY